MSHTALRGIAGAYSCQETYTYTCHGTWMCQLGCDTQTKQVSVLQCRMYWMISVLQTTKTQKVGMSSAGKHNSPLYLSPNLLSGI